MLANVGGLEAGGPGYAIESGAPVLIGGKFGVGGKESGIQFPYASLATGASSSG